MKKRSLLTKKILQTGRFSIACRVYENDGPHVICINGVQQSMAMWSTFIARFSRHYRIVLFDFPNQGKSSFLSGTENMSLDEQVEILHAVLDAAGVKERAMMCAASWGGVVAVAFASKYPSRIKRLVLASLGTKPNQNMVDTIQQGANIDINDRNQIATTLIASFGESLNDQMKQKITEQFKRMSDDDIRTFYEHGLFVISSKKLSDMVNLKNITAKTTLLNGEKDTIIDLDDVRFLATQIPNCELRIVANVGHFLHMEREEVLDIYDEILSKG